MKKKLCAILLTMTMSLSLAACGGVDTQPAIDAFNNASTAYDTVANKVNAEPAAYSEELIATMNELSDTMLEYKDMLESGEELTEEQVTEMIQVFAEVEDWAVDTNANLDAFKAVSANKQPAIDAYNKTSEAFNKVAETINANIDLYAPELVDVMTQMSNVLTEYGTFLNGDNMITDELVAEMVTQLSQIEAWVASAEAEILVNAEGDMDLEAAIAYFNEISTEFDATASIVNENADAFTPEFINTMSELAEILITYKELLQNNYAFTEEEYNLMLQDLAVIAEWLSNAEEDVFG